MTIIIGSDPAVHPRIIVGHDRAKVHQYIHVVQRIRIDLFLVAQEHLHVIECVDVVGPAPECLRNLDYRLGGNSSMVENERVFSREGLVVFVSRSIEVSVSRFPFS